MFQKNEAQEKAIRTHEGQVLLISCPGSGKTTTMIRRIRSMVESGIKESTIVMVTFTDAAATEMKERYVRDYGDCRITFATIHSLCLRILQEFSSEPIRVIPVEVQYTILKQSFKKAGVFYKNSDALKGALMDISAIKNSGTALKDFAPASMEKPKFQKLFPIYEEAKNSSGFIDFDDMLCLCRNLLNQNARALNILRSRYRYLMCDEYQDTNAVQKDILYTLAGPSGNLCVVGDDDQSIYGFRGATPGIMLDFKKDFPNAQSISMDTNYRSRPEIIRYAKNLIGHNKVRFPKDIQASRDGSGKVEFHTAFLREEELSGIAKRIHDLILSGVHAKDIAILARTNLQLEDVAVALDSEGIPYKAGEAIHDDYEHFIFRDLISYLTLMNGVWDKECFLRILNRPSRWLKESAFSGIHGLIKQELIPIAGTHQPYAMKAIEEVDYLYQFLLKHKTDPLCEQVRAIINEACYRAYICDYAENTGAEAGVYFSKLDFFLRESKKYNSVDEWLQAAKQHVAIHRARMKAMTTEAVTLATMHRSKGLEWCHVFIIDCCQSVIPGNHSDSTKGPVKSSEQVTGEIEEERRLFYVAMTRAKENLYLCNYSHRLQKSRKANSEPSMTMVSPSVFLGETKEDLEAKRRKKEEMEEKRKRDVKATYQGFKEGAPSSFKIGMTVHHEKFGQGTVVGKTFLGTRIRFEHEVKIF